VIPVGPGAPCGPAGPDGAGQMLGAQICKPCPGM
jgi:hypothetical protein